MSRARGQAVAERGPSEGTPTDAAFVETRPVRRLVLMFLGRVEAMYRGEVTWKPMALAIETERLTLSLRDVSDAEWYRALVGERGEETPTLAESTARLARFRDLTTEIGIGALTIRRRAEGDAIGYCALIVGRASLDEPEIAYELLRRFHGHGYATEAAQALVVAAAATGRRRLWSTVGAWNEPSLRVLEKVGFRRDHIVTDDRGELVYLTREL
jgi:RimJ/RimL family protein N-acetyltransferase